MIDACELGDGGELFDDDLAEEWDADIYREFDTGSDTWHRPRPGMV